MRTRRKKTRRRDRRKSVGSTVGRMTRIVVVVVALKMDILVEVVWSSSRYLISSRNSITGIRDCRARAECIYTSYIYIY